MTAVRASPFDLLSGLGFHRHYTGVLTPRGAKGVDAYARIAAPTAPPLSQVSGGALAATTYFTKTTLVSPSGETTPSSEASLAVAANNLLKIAPPASAGNATGWNAYVASASGAEALQNATPIALGVSWTEPSSGLLTGGAQPPTANSTGWDVFNLFVADPVASCTYVTDPVDTGFDADLRVFLAATTGFGPGQSGAPALAFAIDTWLAGQNDPASFIAWPSAGYVSMRYLRARLGYTPVQGALAYIQDFVPTIDTAPSMETGNALTVAAGGTAIIFPEQFHAPPQVIANCISSSALSATVASVTASGCTFHVWNASGVDVGGVINYEAIGE